MVYHVFSDINAQLVHFVWSLGKTSGFFKVKQSLHLCRIPGSSQQSDETARFPELSHGVCLLDDLRYRTAAFSNS